jgi:hypothetical protein
MGKSGSCETDSIKRDRGGYQDVGLDDPRVVKQKNGTYRPRQRDVLLDDPRVVKEK